MRSPWRRCRAASRCAPTSSAACSWPGWGALLSIVLSSFASFAALRRAVRPSTCVQLLERCGCRSHAKRALRRLCCFMGAHARVANARVSQVQEPEERGGVASLGQAPTPRCTLFCDAYGRGQRRAKWLRRRENYVAPRTIHITHVDVASEPTPLLMRDDRRLNARTSRRRCFLATWPVAILRLVWEDLDGNHVPSSCFLCTLRQKRMFVHLITRAPSRALVHHTSIYGASMRWASQIAKGLAKVL